MKHFLALLAFIITILIATPLSGCSVHPSKPDNPLTHPLLHEVAVPPTPSPSAKINSNDYDIQYFTDRVDIVKYIPETPVAFVITAEYGRYHFSDKDMPPDMAYEYVDAFEAGVKSAIDWFGHNDDLLDLYFIQRDFDNIYDFEYSGLIGGSGEDGAAWFEYDYSMETPPSPFFASHVLMHEAVHALCDVHNEISNFPRRPEPYDMFWSTFFEEGLATMLEHMYGYDSGRLYDVYLFHYTGGCLNSSDGILYAVNNISEALGHLALHEINTSTFYDELPYDILQSYGTAASFLYYLLEHNGSKEDVRRVYADIYLMEEIYGKDIDGMIAEWLEHIEKYR